MKQKISLILDKEFIQYCELNEVEDVKKLAKETFKRGFDLLKYGSMPEGSLTRKDKDIVTRDVVRSPSSREVVKPTITFEKTLKTKKQLDEVKPRIIEAVPMNSSDGKEALTKLGVRTEKKDIYDE